LIDDIKSILNNRGRDHKVLEKQIEDKMKGYISNDKYKSLEEIK
jgi:hypothetical protein